MPPLLDLCFGTDPPGTPPRWSAVVCAAMIAALGLGCGESPSQTDDPFADYEDRGEVYDQLGDDELVTQVLLDALCDVSWACYAESPGIADEAQEAYGRFESVEQCRRRGHRLLQADQFQQVVEPALEAGRMDVDPSAAESCRRAYRTRVCEEGFESTARDLPPECEAFFGGQLQEGDPCIVSLECGPSLTCDQGAETDGCHGRCTPPESVATCAGETCADDEFCQFHIDEENRETEYRCAPRLAEGSQCGGHDHCEPDLACIHGICTEFSVGAPGDGCVAGAHGSHCRPGLVCSPRPDALTRHDATCSPVGTDGDPCYAQTTSDTTGCAYDHYCTGDEDDPFGTCRPRKTEESICEWSHECRTDYCDLEDDGDGEGVCAPSDPDLCRHPADEPPK